MLNGTALADDDGPRIDWAARVRGIRTSLRLTQAGLGRRLGISGQAVSQYESGRTIPCADVQRKLDALEAELLADDVPPAPTAAPVAAPPRARPAPPARATSRPAGPPPGDAARGRSALGGGIDLAAIAVVVQRLAELQQAYANALAELRALAGGDA